ncbi:MAG: hypothetical protein ACI3VB_02175 [Oscillospiraceae bacterium]
MKNLKQRFCRGGVSPPAVKIYKISLILSCIMLAASLLILVYAGELTAHTYRLHYLGAELYRTPQAILLAASIGALIIDDMLKS